MITVHVLAFSIVFWRIRGFPFRRHRWGIIRGDWPTIYLGWFKVITGPRGIGWWMCRPVDVDWGQDDEGG